MTYLDCLKEELRYKYLSYLFAAVTLGTVCYFNKFANGFLNIILLGCVYAFISLTIESYVKYKESKKIIPRGRRATYLLYLKDEFKYRYLRPLIWSVILGLFLFLSNISFFMTFLFSVSFFLVGLLISAYAKTFYRKF